MYIGGISLSFLSFHRLILLEWIPSTVSLVSQGRLFSKAILNKFQVWVTNTSQNIKLVLHKYNSVTINLSLIIHSATYAIRQVFISEASHKEFNGSSIVYVG